MSSDKKSEPSKEGFLNRWSQRKRDSATVDDGEDAAAVQKEEPHSIAANDVVSENLKTKQPLAADGEDIQLDEDQERVLTDADMPDLNTLNGDSDFSPFFSDGVSKELRNKALKKLFFSGRFAARDGLDDYDDDFTYFEPLGDTVTSDMKYHARRKEKARLAKLEEERLEEERLEAEKLAAEDFNQESLEDQADESPEKVNTESEDISQSEEKIAQDSQPDIKDNEDTAAEDSESDYVASTTVSSKDNDDTQSG